MRVRGAQIGGGEDPSVVYSCFLKSIAHGRAVCCALVHSSSKFVGIRNSLGIVRNRNIKSRHNSASPAPDAYCAHICIYIMTYGLVPVHNSSPIHADVLQNIAAYNTQPLLQQLSSSARSS